MLCLPLIQLKFTDVLRLRVVPVVRHEVLVHADRGEVLELERGPAALEQARAVGARNAQHVAPDVLAEARLLRARSLARPSEVRVHEERWAEDVGAHHGDPVGVAVAVPGVAAAADRLARRPRRRTPSARSSGSAACRTSPPG